MGEQIYSICRSCGKKVDIGDLIKKNNLALCPSCSPKTEKIQPTKVNNNSSKKINLICDLCKYKFKSDNENINLCPYCDKKGHVRKKITSQEIINEVI